MNDLKCSKCGGEFVRIKLKPNMCNCIDEKFREDQERKIRKLKLERLMFKAKAKTSYFDEKSIWGSRGDWSILRSMRWHALAKACKEELRNLK